MEAFNQYFEYQKAVATAKIEIIRRLQKGVEKAPKKRTSQVGVVEQVLNAAGYPLHISKIIELAERNFQVQLDRDSIVSNIIKKVKSGKVFIRTAPNTFALKEYSPEQTHHASRGKGVV